VVAFEAPAPWCFCLDPGMNHKKLHGCKPKAYTSAWMSGCVFAWLSGLGKVFSGINFGCFGRDRNQAGGLFPTAVEPANNRFLSPPLWSGQQPIPSAQHQNPPPGPGSDGAQWLERLGYLGKVSRPGLETDPIHSGHIHMEYGKASGTALSPSRGRAQLPYFSDAFVRAPGLPVCFASVLSMF